MSTIITHAAGFTSIRNDNGIDLPMFFSKHNAAIDAWCNAPQSIKDAFERVTHNGRIPVRVSRYFAPLFDVNIFQASDMQRAYNPLRYTFAALDALGATINET